MIKELFNSIIFWMCFALSILVLALAADGLIEEPLLWVAIIWIVPIVLLFFGVVFIISVFVYEDIKLMNRLDKENMKD